MQTLYYLSKCVYQENKASHPFLKNDGNDVGKDK